MKEYLPEFQAKRFSAKVVKIHRNGGGLLVGVRLVYPISVYNEGLRYKLVCGVFIPHPWQHYSVWHIELGLLTHVIYFYFRKPLPKETKP